MSSAYTSAEKGKQAVRGEEQYVPLVIVEGFLGGAGDIVWGKFEDYLNEPCWVSRRSRRRVLFPHVGPVSSLHDRACELYFTLKGGKIDYGEEHSKQHGHGRYGRNIDRGMYPEWSPVLPLHFLGHSIGGPTVIKLQHLLKTGFFGPTGHADMVLSVNSISAPYRGTQLVYSLGTRPEDAPNVRPYSIGSALLSKLVHLLAFFGPLMPRALDVHAESRSLSFNETSVYTLLRQLWKSDWAESKDAAPFDVTFLAAEERENNGEGVLNPNTFYRSYAAFSTRRTEPNMNTHAPSFRRILTPLLYTTSRVMGTFDFSRLRPVPAFLRQSGLSKRQSVETDIDQSPPDLPSFPELATTIKEEYWANDGVVPLFSQWHPFSCESTRCRHHGSPSILDEENINSEELTRGAFHVYEFDESHHLSVAPLWTSSSQQRLFWEKIGFWLRAIESQ